MSTPSQRRLPRLRRALRLTLLAAGGVVDLALLVALARVVLYSQEDDREHTASKGRYLERLAGLTGGEPTGPNIVVVLFDDLGQGDLGAYGGRSIATPRLDTLAGQGILFRHGYAASPYCSASRAALLTGRHAFRSGLDHVLQPRGTWQDNLLRIGGRNRRLPEEEITLPEALAAAGYRTAMFGKWHLGDRAPSLPNDRGFERFYGLLFSNDQGEPAVYEDGEVIEEHPIDQTTLTRRYTERAVAFIEESAGEPFFLYLPHTFPHAPLRVAPERLGRSRGGLYGDVVEELDESVGAVVDALRRTGAAERTLVIVTSDNGPWFQGSPGSHRGRKTDVFEGGVRVPFIAWWPGRIRSGRVVDEPATGLDLFPTVMELAGLPLPDDRVVDGESLAGLLDGTSSAAHGPVYYHLIGGAKAVRDGRFKYHETARVPYGNPMSWSWAPWKKRGPWLFDLLADSRESYDVSDHYPEEAARLRDLLARHGAEIDENPRGWR